LTKYFVKWSDSQPGLESSRSKRNIHRLNWL